MHNAHARLSSLPGDREERIKSIQDKRFGGVEMVIEQVDDPHNIGAILRTCDAVGIGVVHLIYEQSRPPRMSELKSTSAASAVKWLTIKKWHSAQECIADIKSRGIVVYATALSPKAISQYDCDSTRPSAIIMGNEKDGISPALISLSDHTIAIPMRGFVQSLNVSVAAAVVMYEVLRQRS